MSDILSADIDLEKLYNRKAIKFDGVPPDTDPLAMGFENKIKIGELEAKIDLLNIKIKELEVEMLWLKRMAKGNNGG